MLKKKNKYSKGFGSIRILITTEKTPSFSFLPPPSKPYTNPELGHLESGIIHLKYQELKSTIKGFPSLVMLLSYMTPKGSKLESGV